MKVVAKTTELVVERSDGELWGRVEVNKNLITDFAPTLDTLIKKMKAAIYNIENVEIENFEISYDLTSFFEQYSFLDISDIATRSGINASLMRQYASGVKYPSAERVQQIEDAIRKIGKDLSKVRLHHRTKQYA